MTIQLFRQLFMGAICLMGMVAVSVAEAVVPIKINAHAIHFGGQIVYRYQVENNSASTIHQLRLGLVVVGKELPGKPWSLNPKYWDVPAPLELAQCKPFLSMDCNVAVFQFDYMTEPKTRISMRGVESNLTPPPKVLSGANYIRPGTLSSVAELIIPPAYQSTDYLTASGEVFLLDNNTKDANGKVIASVEIPFTKVDVTPPILTITLTPNSVRENDKLIPIATTLTVKDDYDPQPEIKLESITSNELLEAGDIRDATLGTDDRQFLLKAEHEGKNTTERVYLVVYSATDASGNKTMASATVTVKPENEGRGEQQREKR